MRVLLAGPDYEENLSIRYLSSSLRSAGHETILASFNSPADIPAVAAAAASAEIVGLSLCFQSRAREFLRLAQTIKSRHPGKLIVAGGHYASCAAEPLLAHHPEIDIIVVHEGEKTLVEIAGGMACLEERLPHIAGIAYREGAQVRFTASRRMLDDLDVLPFPDRRGPVHWIAGVPTGYLMGSRGCYGNCAYCCITTLHQLATGKRFRQRDTELIADEMAALYRERGVRQFIFHDDNFLVPSQAMNHARLSAFEKAFKRRGLRDIALVIKCRPADASPEILRRLQALGLVRLFLGIESSTERGLLILERKQSVEESERALEACAELDLSAQFTMMMFNPDATPDTLRSDVAFMRRFSGNPLNFCRTEIYAGTPLEKKMIALGRARGDYLARVYNLSDPVADLACTLSLALFESRCWSNDSLMQNTIGLDHLASVLKRFSRGPRHASLCQRVSRWVREVNLDTIGLLDEAIALSASTAGRGNAALEDAVQVLRERESRTRQDFRCQGASLRAELESFRYPDMLRPTSRISLSGHRLARQAAAALLAIGLPATAASLQACQEAKTPPASTAGQDKTTCSLMGAITDSAGAAISNAAITITNLDTGAVLSLTANASGEYLAGALPAGRYTVKASAAGFRPAEKTGIVLKEGARERGDLTLNVDVNGFGCCEYAAGPLQVMEDLSTKKKPFTYRVGEAEDHNTFQGIAKLVYGDSKDWVQIFEANRQKIEKPGYLPYGTEILVPKRKRNVPKLLSKVLPAYPDPARQAGVVGDVVLDVTLQTDGGVDRVEVIDGNPLLAEAAVAAVKQWRYRPSSVNVKPAKFVVVVSFSKGGKVR